MTDFPLYTRVLVVSCAALGLIVWGAGTALFAPRGWAGRGLLAGLGAAAGGGGLSLFMPSLATPAGLVAVASVVVLTVAGADRARAGVLAGVRALLRPRVGGAAAAVLAAGWGGYEFWRYERAVEDEANRTLGEVGMEVPFTEPAAAAAYTDCGGPVTLSYAPAPLPAAEAAEVERKAAAIRTTAGRWIRRGPADDASNCHGWTFTGGRYVIGGAQVPGILADNGYEQVAAAAAGDLCVYRTPDGRVSHTGVVRAALADGTVLVESKWGRLGVFLHPAGESCYGDGFTYHRSPRAGHLLAGLDDPDGPTAPAVTASPPP